MMFGHNGDNNQQTQTTQASSPPLPDTPMPIADGVLSANNDVTPAPQPSAPVSPQFLTPPAEPMLSSGIDDQAASPASSGDGIGENVELLSLKQDALQQLSPLLSHLDQTPEEKFRTTMMMIQTTDNQDLIKSAYDAAQQITDDKAKAQALLDIVNEINYFTQHPAA